MPVLLAIDDDLPTLLLFRQMFRDAGVTVLPGHTGSAQLPTLGF